MGLTVSIGVGPDFLDGKASTALHVRNGTMTELLCFVRMNNNQYVCAGLGAQLERQLDSYHREHFYFFLEMSAVKRTNHMC